jgi:phosphoglycolate phosphatase
MNPIGIIFDLDGTLLDTLEDIAGAVDHALSEFGLPNHPLDRYRDFIGNGFATLIQRALPMGIAKEVEAQVQEVARQQYSQGWKNRTRLYPGVGDLLNTLKSRPICLGILSNKPHHFTLETVSHFLGDGSFDPIYGEREGVPRKPAPLVPLAIAAQWQLSPQEIFLVGDSEVDMMTAAAAGMRGIGVTWGFRPPEMLVQHGAQRLIDHPDELLDLLPG